MSHGLSAYNKRGCRCDVCCAAAAAQRAGHRDDRRAYRQARHDAMVAGFVNPPHGTHATYCNFACRCDPCRQAHRDVMRARRHPEAVGA